MHAKVECKQCVIQVNWRLQKLIDFQQSYSRTTAGPRMSALVQTSLVFESTQSLSQSVRAVLQTSDMSLNEAFHKLDTEGFIWLGTFFLLEML